MAKKIVASLGAIALLISPICAAAQQPASPPITEPSDPVWLIGTGQFSCGQFIAYQRQKNEAQLNLIVQWIWGFMSAYNMRGSFQTKGVQTTQIADLPDQPTVLLYVEKYCGAHPTHKLTQATLSLMDTIGAEIDRGLKDG